MLLIFGGLPGSGKTELARHIAKVLSAVYVRIDSIEQAIRNVNQNKVDVEGYEVAYRIAADNLSNGLSVVIDSVNPVEATRSAFRNIALQLQVEFKQIEIKCSNQDEHRQRVESRTSDIPGLKLPTWEDVVNREYELWADVDFVIDTAGKTLQQSKEKLEKNLDDLTLISS